MRQEQKIAPFAGSAYIRYSFTELLLPETDKPNNLEYGCANTKICPVLFRAPE